MATLPSEHTSKPQPDPRGLVHEQRTVAESFGSDAGRYDRARPSYPAALIDRIIAASPGAGAPRILDVGCGTGISARLFQAAGCPGLGADAAGGAFTMDYATVAATAAREHGASR